MWTNIYIRKHELGLWFRHGDLHQVMKPGRHRISQLWPWSKGNSFELVDTLCPRFEHDLLKVLATEPDLASRLTIVELNDDERALVWIDGRLSAMLNCGQHAFWKTMSTIEVERFNVNDGRFRHARMDAIMNFPGAVRLFSGVRVESHETILVYHDGEMKEQLGPGHYVFWRGGPTITWKSVDLREQMVDIQGQEIMTADKVSLRMNLVVTHRVIDPVKAVTEVCDWAQALYREAQLGLRSAIGGRSLEKLLSDKDEVGAEIRNLLAPRAAEFGVAVSGVGLRDLILPGDMKIILNEVIVATKQAEANLIRRREETAAARSQANTAKLLAENPALARMKELEALQEILSGSNATFVLGSGDLSEQIGSLIRRQTAASD